MMPSRTSSAFAEGGHYVIRDNWIPESDFMIIKSGVLAWVARGSAPMLTAISSALFYGSKAGP